MRTALVVAAVCVGLAGCAIQRPVAVVSVPTTPEMTPPPSASMLVPGADSVPSAGGQGLPRTLPTQPPRQLADGSKVPAIVGAGAREAFVLFFRGGEQTRDCARNLFPRSDGLAQEHPASFASPFGKSRIRQDRDVPGNARLALPEDVRKLAHGKLHRSDQPHDAEPRGIA